jgi:hypothetical protein
LPDHNPDPQILSTSDLNRDIRRIDFVENRQLEQKYLDTKGTFLMSNIPAHEIFLFHGTNDANISSILGSIL